MDQLQDAFDAAFADGQTDLDIVELGPGLYDDGRYVSSALVHLIGAGRDQTIITNTDPVTPLGSAILAINPPGAGTRISDLTVRIGPGDSTHGFATDGTVERVRLEAAPGSTPSLGVDMNGGVLRDAEVVLPLTSTLRAGTLSNVDVENSSFQAGGGLFMQNGTARRVRIEATGEGFGAGFGPVRLENSLVRVRGVDAVGVRTAGSDSGASLALSHVSVIGDVSPGALGLRAVDASMPSVAFEYDVTVRNSLFRGFLNSAHRQGTPGTVGGMCSPCQVTMNLLFEHSSLDMVPGDTGGPGTLTVMNAGNFIAADPRLADFRAGDFRPRFGSLLIDAGDPIGPGGSPFYVNESTIDLAGGLRFVNLRRDIGAFEYQRGAPGVPSIAFSRAPALLYRRVTITSAATDPDPFDALTFRFSVDGRAAGSGARLVRRFTTLGVHRIGVRVVDPTDQAAVASRTLRVVARRGACANRRGGGRRADVFKGTSAGDKFVGGKGNDRLKGGGGADCLTGGPGRDRLLGGSGKDRLAGGPGPDRIDCGPGSDTVIAGKGDRLRRCERVR